MHKVEIVTCNKISSGDSSSSSSTKCSNSMCRSNSSSNGHTVEIGNNAVHGIQSGVLVFVAFHSIVFNLLY